MWMENHGAGEPCPTSGRDSSVSPRGRNTLRITGGDPTGSPPAFVPVGLGKSFGLTLASWGTNQIPWRWRRLRTRRGNRGFPPDSSQDWRPSFLAETDRTGSRHKFPSHRPLKEYK